MSVVAVKAIILRDVRAAFRHKSSFGTALIRPLIWLLIVGSGIQATFKQVGPYDYQFFMIPGLIGMVLLFNGALSALNITYDKSSGVNNLLTIAPLSRSTILLSRIMSATIISLVHLLIFLIVLSVFGFIHTVKFIPMIFPVALIAASIGILIATFSRDFINFSIIINYIMLPMFFLSGALYPLQNLPWYLHTLVLVNPFSYAVDLIQHGFQLDAVVRFSLLADVGVLAGFFILFVLISCWRYNRAD